MSKEVFDYIIIGAGAAGLHLAMAMQEDDWFSNKSILILDKDPKDQNDKTWSYWEKGDGKWDHIIKKSWDHGTFVGNGKTVRLTFDPYRYKTMHSIDFYAEAKHKLKASKQFTWIISEVIDVVDGSPSQVISAEHTYDGFFVFDSRVDPDFQNQNANYHYVLQHFKGWYIETEEASFDPDNFVMMDYRVKWKDSTSFTYVLPFSEHEAIVEFTLFNEELIEDHEYDRLLNQYIEEVLKIKKFKIKAIEKGVIPMSDYPFHKGSTDHITKIGQAGSWVKPSSGYSFKRAELLSEKLIHNIKTGVRPDTGMIKNKFRFYDSILLGVLHKQNHLGEQLFSDMYQKNSIQQIFKFLDEETSLTEDIKIMSRFQYGPFIQSLLRYIRK